MGRRARNLTGQRFGRLVAKYPTDKRSGTAVVWHCECDCGRSCEATSLGLTSGRTKNCGCIKKDITGFRYGRLTAIRPTDQVRHHTRVWVCLCDCGQECHVPLGSLTAGIVKSCGCLSKENWEKGYERMREANLRDSLVDGTNVSKLTTTPNSNSKAKVKGVCFDAGKYRAYITFQGKRHHLGRYSTIKDAEAARRQAEDILWGEFFDSHPELKRDKK
ncbi:hypothetical protein Ami103574_02650 [Aminipila butyrica]|uniref:AP2 domain-containing protein n=1 Tax=Aminipila butyrica TaxID=433296 RepID=A0A858BSU3_9FIRM|nr:hypothetical protein [Aminipila butyrica]QIB68279.1 hypothetical protein Ami103574_02650 [Aminipila butyrica]